MLDVCLPLELNDQRPIRYLFLDVNAYFATIEQQYDPSLRGKPVVVAPLDAETTCAVAASYEAKAFGIKTGTRICDARDLCPGLIVKTAQFALYSHYHKKIADAVESVLPVQKAHSIDEFQCALIGAERLPENAEAIAKRIKQAIRQKAGEAILCSIGLAPNPFLAKLGTDLQKPDGLVMIQAYELPERLRGLKVTEFCGINYRMKARLQAAGIFTSDDMIGATRGELTHAFRSINGERWWYWLRGYDIPGPPTKRGSLGHSNVLPPELRTPRGCYDVLLRLAQKATARLRAEQLWACEMDVAVKGRRSWSGNVKLPPTQDSITVMRALDELWETADFLLPHQVALTFTRVRPGEELTPSLFEPTRDLSLFSHAMDSVNRRFGKNKVYNAGIERTKDTADEKIAFQKTDLFSEGKDDNLWNAADVI